jgi:hypothetical protein
MNNEYNKNELSIEAQKLLEEAIRIYKKGSPERISLSIEIPIKGLSLLRRDN